MAITGSLVFDAEILAHRIQRNDPLPRQLSYSSPSVQLSSAARARAAR